MKRIWIAIIAFILLIASCISEIIWMSITTENFKDQIDSVNQAVLEDNIDSAIAISEDMILTWSHTHNKLAVFIDHNSLEGIDQSVGVILMCLQKNNLDDFYLEISKINSLIDNLLDTEMPTIYNIL